VAISFNTGAYANLQSKIVQITTAKHVSDKINNLLGPGVADKPWCDVNTGFCHRETQVREWLFIPFWNLEVEGGLRACAYWLVKKFSLREPYYRSALVSKVPRCDYGMVVWTVTHKRGSAGDWARWNSNRRGKPSYRLVKYCYWP